MCMLDINQLGCTLAVSNLLLLRYVHMYMLDINQLGCTLAVSNLLSLPSCMYGYIHT